MATHVHLHIAELGKGLVATGCQTAIRPLPCMAAPVNDQGVFAGKAAIAVRIRAKPGPLSCVQAEMGCQTARLRKAFVTAGARTDPGFFSRMGAPVSGQIATVNEALAATCNRAGISSLPCVATQMNSQGVFAGKAVATERLRATPGALPCVKAPVDGQTARLGKAHATVGVRTHPGLFFRVCAPVSGQGAAAVKAFVPVGHRAGPKTSARVAAHRIRQAASAGGAPAAVRIMPDKTPLQCCCASPPAHWQSGSARENTTTAGLITPPGIGSRVSPQPGVDNRIRGACAGADTDNPFGAGLRQTGCHRPWTPEARPATTRRLCAFLPEDGLQPRLAAQGVRPPPRHSGRPQALQPARHTHSAALSMETLQGLGPATGQVP